MAQFIAYDEGEDWKFGCCNTCVYRGGIDCDRCEDADHYEFDTDLAEDDEFDRAALRVIPIVAAAARTLELEPA